MLAITELPALNATLNLTSAILLATGLLLHPQKNIRAHQDLHGGRADHEHGIPDVIT